MGGGQKIDRPYPIVGFGRDFEGETTGPRIIRHDG